MLVDRQSRKDSSAKTSKVTNKSIQYLLIGSEDVGDSGGDIYTELGTASLL